MTLATSNRHKRGPTPRNTGDRASDPQKLPTRTTSDRQLQAGRRPPECHARGSVVRRSWPVPPCRPFREASSRYACTPASIRTVSKDAASSPTAVSHGFPAKRGTVRLRADRLVRTSKKVQNPEDDRLHCEACARPRPSGRVLAGRTRSSAAAQLGPEPHDCYVAIAIARSAPAREQKQSSRARSPDAPDWAIASVRPRSERRLPLRSHSRERGGEA